MSSKDKNNDQDDATENEVADHTEDTSDVRPDHDKNAPDDAASMAAQDHEKDDLSGIEDAEVVNDQMSDETTLSDDMTTGADDVITGTAPDTEADSPAENGDGDPVDEDQGGLDEPAEQGNAPASADASRFTPDEPAAVAPPPPQKSGGGFFPAVLGGLVAAGVGFGAAQFLGGDLLGGGQAAQRAAAEQDAKLSDVAAKLDALIGSLGAPESGGVDAKLDALGDDLTKQVTDIASGISGGLSELDTRMSALGDRMRALELTPLTESSEASQQAFSSYEKDIEQLRAELEEQIAATEAAKADAEARVAEAQADIEAAALKTARLQKQAEDQARVAQEQADAKTRAAAIREAMASLDSYLQTGQPYGYALDILGEGVEVPAPLTAAAESGVVTLPELRDSFPDLARDALDASIRESVDDDIVERVVAFAKAQTGLRSLAPREGDDPDAVLSRAEAALEIGDLTATLTELGQLPPAGQQVMADWVEKAQTRLSVTEAADTLANTLLAN